MRGGKGEYEISRPATNRALSKEKRPVDSSAAFRNPANAFAIMFKVLCWWFLLEWIFAHRQLPGICARATAASPSVGRLPKQISFSIYDREHKDFVRIRFGEEKMRRNAEGQNAGPGKKAFDDFRAVLLDRREQGSMMHRFLRSAILLAIAVPPLFLAAQSAWGQRAPIEIVANLTDAPRRLYHAEIDLPVKAGPLDLITPEWIPGEHMPNGPAQNITGVVFTANGKTLPWRRDSVDLYEFHVTVPDGVTTLHAHLDCIVNARVSEKLAVLEWEKLLLYPARVPVRDIPIRPSVKV